MTEHPFRKKLSKELFSVLRAEGFKGSGATLRRNSKPLIHVFNIQAGTKLYAGGCFINLGVHLEGLQLPGGSLLASAEKITEPECLFRTRIDPPRGEPSWRYPTDEGSMNKLLAEIQEEWVNHGRAFFDSYSYPESFEKLINECNLVTTDAYRLVLNARIALRLGDLPRAVAFAQNVLNRLGVWEVFRSECLLLMQDAKDAGYFGPAESRKQLNWPD
jgi:hypothetical protein